jgi:hypothetical protein
MVQVTWYQYAGPSEWPSWGHGYDLNMGNGNGPPGVNGYCDQGDTYAGSPNEACGGKWNWGPTDLKVWIPVDCSTESRCAATCYGGTGIWTCDGVYYCCDVCTGNHACAGSVRQGARGSCTARAMCKYLQRGVNLKKMHNYRLTFDRSGKEPSYPRLILFNSRLHSHLICHAHVLASKYTVASVAALSACRDGRCGSRASPSRGR